MQPVELLQGQLKIDKAVLHRVLVNDNIYVHLAPASSLQLSLMHSDHYPLLAFRMRIKFAFL